MFLVCGEALWDLFAQESADGLSFDARIGGSPFNVAVGLSRLGQATALFTGLSTDQMGARLWSALEREDVETRFLVRTGRPSTLSLVDVAPDGSPAYAFYGGDAADRAVTSADVPDLGPDVWGLHAGSFSLVTEPVGSSLLGLFAREAGRRLITLDPNVRLAVEPDRARWRARIDDFMRHSDVVKVSEEDLGLLYPGAAPAEIAAGWRKVGPALVVVTHGAAGAEAFGSAGHATVSGRRVEVVDTVGAGDSFQAALIAGLAERGVTNRARLDAMTTDDAAALVDFAVRAAATTCQRRGADLPRRAELARASKETV